MNEKVEYKIYILVFFGVITLNTPFIYGGLINDTTIASIPIIYLYLCFIWAFYIYLIYRVSKKIKID